MAQPPRKAFAWKTGHDVAVANLTVVEVDLYSYTKPFQLYPNAQPVEPFPVRRKTLDSYERGDGELTVVWNFAKLPLAALYYVIDTYLVTSTVEVDSKAITIYTLKRAPDVYLRYNAYLAYPKAGDDYRIEGNAALDVKFRFNGLEAI